MCFKNSTFILGVLALNALVVQARANPDVVATHDPQALDEAVYRSDIASEYNLSDLRTLLGISHQLIHGIYTSHIDQHDAKADAVKEEASLLIDKIENILDRSDVSTDSQENMRLYQNLIAALDLSARFPNKNHPLVQTCDDMKYLLELALALDDANRYLATNEAILEEFSKKDLAVYGDLGVEKALDAANTVKVGAQIGAEQSVAKNARGTTQGTSLKISGDTTLDSKVLSITGALGATITKETNIIGHNADSRKNAATKLKEVLLNAPKEYTEFVKKRKIIEQKSKDLNRHLERVEKLFRLYSGNTGAQLSFLFADPKYNTEKTKKTKLSGSVKAETSVLSSILNIKVNASYERIKYKKHNDIYSFIKSESLPAAGDFMSLKKIALLCGKYSNIKSAYDKKGNCNEEILQKKVKQYMEGHGNFKYPSNFATHIEYYANTLQLMSENKENKKVLKQLQKTKDKLESTLKCNGRLDTLYTAYFMGACYSALMPDTEQEVWEKIQRSLEKIVMFLGESRAFFKHNREPQKTCEGSRRTLKLSLGGEFLSLTVESLKDSPYIYDNGVEIDLDLDISKANKLYDKLLTAKKGYDFIQAKLEEHKINKPLECFKAIEEAMGKTKKRIIHQIAKAAKMSDEEADRIFNQIVDAIVFVKQTVDKNQDGLRFKSAVGKVVEFLFSHSKNRVRFIFREEPATKSMEYIGAIIMSTRDTRAEIESSKFTKQLPAEISADFGVKRATKSGYINLNYSSIYAPLKNIIDYCFIKVADFGKVPPIEDIASYTRESFPEEYLLGVANNLAKMVFIKKIGTDLGLIKKSNTLNKTKQDKQIEDFENLLANKDLSTIDNVAEFLAHYGRLFFICVAKPYNENRYETKKRFGI